MFNRSAIAMIVQSTKSIFESAYCCMTSAVRPISSSVGCTMSIEPAASECRKKLNSRETPLLRVMNASSGKTVDGITISDSASNTCLQLSRMRSCVESKASRNPVSNNAAIFLNTKIAKRFRHRVFLQRAATNQGLSHRLNQSMDTFYATVQLAHDLPFVLAETVSLLSLPYTTRSVRLWKAGAAILSAESQCTHHPFQHRRLQHPCIVAGS